MSEQTEKKILSPEQAVQAACILFELNTREQDLLEMAQRAGVPCDDEASRRALTREWYGFVHAAVVYGLMAQASNQVMAEYLRSTRTLLSQMAGYTPEQIESFIDDTFSSYIRLMAQNQQKQCPSLFYQRLVGEGALETLPKERVAFLSGMIAHHEGAVDMAKVFLATPKKDQDPQVTAWADDVIKVQEKEIAEMKDLLKPLGGIEESAYAPMKKAMQHMLEEGKNLGANMRFVELMLPHHAMALEMSVPALLGSNNPQILNLAENIIISQAKEMRQFKAWIAEHHKK